LLVIRLTRRGFGRVTLSFAQRSLLLFLFLPFLAPRAVSPLSFSPISTVIWLECHWILRCGGLISCPATPYMRPFEFLPALLFARQGTSQDNAEIGRRGCAMSRSSQTPIGGSRGRPDMAQGTVKFFNSQKGFGFIQPTDGGADVFVHISAVERAGMSNLNEGQKLSYDVVSERGKLAASNLQNV
jgi:cold shock protein